ncbi:MAG: ribosome biogenesis GTP-binding protein YihA/YsxC [Oscillospiraceae bacterium]|nr:ribosome biogenesis GTP-binding protein YihA/YsxC [Oscillospiraceae bacterium]
MNVHNVEFLKSVTSPENFIDDERPQIVFAGKSNVGKSSVLNCVLRRKNFARVGQTPGKTVHINYFLVDQKAYFVDLPGYGYAKVSKTERDRWGRLMEQYFGAGLIDLGVMIVDARHKPTKDDCVMAAWFKETGCPLMIVANKVDKLAKSHIEPNMAVIRETLGLSSEVEIIPFSAEKGVGREALLARLQEAAAVPGEADLPEEAPSL